MKTTHISASVLTLLLSAALGVGDDAQILEPTRYLCFDTDATTATGDCQGLDSPFKDTHFYWFHFKDFEDKIVASPGVTMTAHCNITAFGCPFISTQAFPVGNTDSVDEDDGAIDGLGRTVNGRGQTIYADGSVTFTFDAGILGSLPTHVGVAWTDGGVGTATTFEAWDADGLSLGKVLVHIADGTNAGTTAEDHFFGAIDPHGIYAMKISNSLGGIELDHLQYGGGPPPPHWIGFGAVRHNLPDETGNDALLGEAQERLVRWDRVVGIVVPGEGVGQGWGSIRGHESPWSSAGGFAELSLTRENLRFGAEGLVLATGDAIGTPGYVTDVLGTIVCDVDGSLHGDSVVVETPLVPLDRHGNASFNGSVSPLPMECYAEPDIAFLVRVPPPPPTEPPGMNLQRELMDRPRR